MSSQNYINHVALVLDASSSMYRHSDKLIEVVDTLVQHLAKRSQELDQETRVTVYIFSNNVRCVIYDKDVLRLPSIKAHYHTGGMTALIDATLRSQDDLAHTWEGYGDHAFLTYVLTDGQENQSRHAMSDLTHRLGALRENWTIACLVPDQMGAFEAKRFGFPAANVAVWDATSSSGVEEVGETIRAATDTYMAARATGVRGTKTLFTPATGQVDAQKVSAAGLTPLDPSKYVLVPVTTEMRIDEFVKQCTTNYQVGKAYYQLTGGRKPKGKRGIIVQGNKAVAVLDKRTNQVFTGAAARKLVGLPDETITVDPTDTKGDYLLFVQSTSLNRILGAGSKLLMML